MTPAELAEAAATSLRGGLATPDEEIQQARIALVAYWRDVAISCGVRNPPTDYLHLTIFWERLAGLHAVTV